MTQLNPAPLAMAAASQSPELQHLLTQPGTGRTICHFAKGELIFVEGDVTSAVFYIQKGHVKISASSHDGKEAVLNLAGIGDFLGELAPSKDTVHETSAAALTDCLVLRITTIELGRLIREEQSFSAFFVSFLASRNRQLQKALADHLFDHCEKRLARTLLSLAGLKNGQTLVVVAPRITQQILAAMVGTTRPRISFFMNRFKQQRLIEYKGRDLYINHTLLQFVEPDRLAEQRL